MTGGYPTVRLPVRVQQNVGDGADLDRVTFFVANGWQALDGARLLDSADPPTVRPGRLRAVGDGWQVTIDSQPGVDWNSLARTGDSQITHIGELRRLDGATFHGDQVFGVLDRLRLAMSVAAGRTVTTAIPVGWSHGSPVWSRWQPGRFHPVTPFGDFLNQSIASKQLTDLISATLEATADPAAYDAVRYATSYLIHSGADLGYDLGIAACMSGLQLLSYHHLVATGAYSHGKWKDLNLVGQVEQLLTQLGIPVSVPAHFAGLSALTLAVNQRRAASSPQSPPSPLAGVIDLRNVVTHPGSQTPGSVAVDQWADGNVFTRRLLLFTVLATVGYQGKFAHTIVDRAGGGFTGSSQPVPWAAAPPHQH